MTGEVILNVDNGNENVTMEFDDLGELAELLKLAGVSRKCQSDPETMDVDVANGMISMPTMTDENADYDYGINPTSRKGYVYDVDPYKYQGDAEIRTRPVPYRSGDNPLIREGKSFVKYLLEVEENDDEWESYEKRVARIAVMLAKETGISVKDGNKIAKQTGGDGGLTNAAWYARAREKVRK